MNIFNKKPKLKTWDLPEGHVVIPAFIDRGVQYYELKDILNSFAVRAMSALAVYEEWEMRITKEDLTEFIINFENFLRNPKEINVIDMVKIVELLKERLTFPVPTEDIAYKFAAIRYFDANESPFKADPEYMKAKIKRWKEADSEVDHFFILQRHRDMLPLPELSEDVLRKCLIAFEKVNASQMEYIRGLSSHNQQKQDSSNAQ
jgi:hypothetical protein